MNLRERVLEAIGPKGVRAQALYARLCGESPAILDCALAALLRAGLLELRGGEYRRPSASRWAETGRDVRRPGPQPRAEEALPAAGRSIGPAPQRSLAPRPLAAGRSERAIRADLAGQLEEIFIRWERRLAADRRALSCAG